MNSQKLRILVIDDEEIACKRLKAALDKDGYEVEVYENGHEAMDRFEEKPFDIVISDIRMEDMDGFQVLERIQKSSNQAKVILITGYATIEIARTVAAKGAFDCIAKPFNPNELRASIAKAAASLERTERV